MTTLSLNHLNNIHDNRLSAITPFTENFTITIAELINDILTVGDDFSVFPQI